ncbi:hypothetical protein VOLCADRAFT_104731 [Volvox carteri f. nagariensis]|uniref:Reverse transcriptase domain-containing protein n=1 Tax=Volvox carteri f. nagariensis TaxID=3068 RepID=D8TVC5_VOLCA|nr:uncharacterized protein VOLCADRAFT_104731 [Volvox carteri f. nagariensis]EFJ48555.1 hypothetical protein VOLCADRAFT_104731 [Volvox carteri f. nagariensis]|eukprot:XP_002950354.1 hypothetical protein VOLCADRAFT_104731 [Volvox carteri f. nagariensis]
MGTKRLATVDAPSPPPAKQPHSELSVPGTAASSTSTATPTSPASCSAPALSRWSTLREQSVSLAGGDLTNLLFVDDVSLVATGHDRAECLLGLLEAYCKATGMAANAAKCEVLIFGGATRITGAKACHYMNWMGAAPSRGFVTVERLKMSCMFSKNVPLTRAYGLSMMVT